MDQDEKGKKRAHDVELELSNTYEPLKWKKSKRAETRPCPICNEDIPLRLLGKHADLEYRRVEDIMYGDMPIVDVSSEPGPSTGRRGAALKARKSLTAHLGPNLDNSERVEKTIRLLTRNRKQRHTKLKQIIALEDPSNHSPSVKPPWCKISCPICHDNLRGDSDVVDAHIDACVAHASRLQAQADEEAKRHNDVDVDAWEEYEVDGETRLRLSNITGLRGTGFHIRDKNQPDIEEDVDIDGNDEAEFGDAQFTEHDVLVTSGEDESELNVDGQYEVDRKALKELIADDVVIAKQMLPDMLEVKPQKDLAIGLRDADRINKEIEKAKQSENLPALVTALEKKIHQLEDMRVPSFYLHCRICLDPYDEPTVSIGCWHTCCRNCWLRCLGSTKLCPICKRITAAKDLRRIYM